MAMRLAVLASGGGSNLQAIVDAIAAGTLDARLVGVFSDQPACAALQRVPAALRWSASPGEYPDRAAFDLALGDAIAEAGADWIACAGYMRILGPGFCRRFNGRLLNIHPSRLPAHPGLHTHRRVLAAGDREHGASVHFVTEALDGGPVIAQTRVPVLADDSPERLAARVLATEHRLFPEVLRWAAAGRLEQRGEQVWIDGQPRFTPVQIDCPT